MHDHKCSTSRGFEKLPYFQNFTVEILGQLLFEGLIPSPTSCFRTEVTNRIRGGNWRALAEHKRICFPWAIIELKPEAKRAHQCYRQAANAASIALCMFERLAKFADVQVEAQHIPPVITLTFVGQVVRLWIAYSTLDESGQRHHVCQSIFSSRT
jgi:hypothetical protein